MLTTEELKKHMVAIVSLYLYTLMNIFILKIFGTISSITALLKITFTIAVDWVKDQRLEYGSQWEEKSLPGHGFTPKQLFWISWGQVWCAKWRDGALKQQIKTGAHSPGEFRIRGSLSNNVDFSRDFNCPKGSGMNPEKKCTVW